MLHSLLFVALAGTKLVQNDNFTGTGTVNSAVSFLEYEGPAVLFRPDSGYPLTVRWIDVLSVTYNQGAPGAKAAYQLDVWDERGGRIDPPQKVDGGRYAPIFTNNFELTTQTTAFNRIELTPPMVVSSGGVFVSLGENLSTMDDDATVAIDTAPLKPGANWYRSGSGTFSQLELPDAGFLRGISHNWIIRLVLEVPDMPVTVTSVFPGAGVSTAPTPIVITGTNFEVGAQAFVGTTSLTITGSMPPTNLQATVPPGLTPGRYDVKVQNPGGASGVLTNGFEVLLGDGGSGTGGGAGGGSGGAGGGGGTGGGGAPGVLLLDDITPADGYNEETTKVVLTGAGFQDGAQVLIGPSVLDVVTVKSSAVINAEIAPGLTQGIYDVTVINLDGERSKLRNAFTMNAGTRTKSGCGCGSSGLEPLALALVLAAWRGRYRRRRPGVQ